MDKNKKIPPSKEDEGDDNKEKRNLFPIIFFGALTLLFVGTYIFLHPYVDKPPEITPAENAAIQKENAGNITGAIDEYNNLLNKESNEERRCIYFTRVAKLYSQLEKEEIAKRYYENAANIAGEKNFTTCMYEAMFWRWYYGKNGTYLLKAVEIAEKLNDNKKKFYSYSYLANYYFDLKDFTKAKETYDKAMALSNEGDAKTIGYNYLGIGAIYTEWSIYDIALQNLKLAKNYFKKSDDEGGLLNTYLRIAYVYARSNDNKNALAYYEKAGKISNMTDNYSSPTLEIAHIYMMLAQKKLEEKEYDDAIERAKESLNLFIASRGSEQDVANVQNILCYAYFVSEKNVEARECYNLLKIDLLNNEENKFKAYVARASLNGFFGLKYSWSGIKEITIIEDENGTIKQTNISCVRISLALEDYKKANKIGKNINVSNEELNNITNKISELENRTKECTAS